MENPKPFCFNIKKFKTYVLGADPSNFSDHGKRKEFEYVFGILSDDPRYFSGILKNLIEVGLHLEDVYVQNIIPEYLEDETSRNKDWEKHAKRWLPVIKTEFDKLNPEGTKPVLVTAERIMKFLSIHSSKLPETKEIYSDLSTSLFFVKPKDNKLHRPLLAFYRHPSYNLSKKKRYCELIKKKLV